MKLIFNSMDFEDLKELIREMIKDEILEFSGVAALGGGPILPIGTSPSNFNSKLSNPEEKKTRKSKRRKNKIKR